jgi:hypothetical protein
MAEALPKPFNYLFRKGGHRAGRGLRFAILAYLEGVATISPKTSGEAIEIPVTRLYIQRLDRPSPARYYDISSRQVQAQLSGYLSTRAFVGRQFTVEAHGYKPSKQFSLRVMPLEGI